MSERRPIITAILSVVIALIRRIPTRAKCRCCESECMNDEDNISIDSNEPINEIIPTVPKQSEE